MPIQVLIRVSYRKLTLNSGNYLSIMGFRTFKFRCDQWISVFCCKENVPRTNLENLRLNCYIYQYHFIRFPFSEVYLILTTRRLGSCHWFCSQLSYLNHWNDAWYTGLFTVNWLLLQIFVQNHIILKRRREVPRFCSSWTRGFEALVICHLVPGLASQRHGGRHTQLLQRSSELRWPLQIHSVVWGGRQRGGSAYLEIIQSLLYCRVGNCYVWAVEVAHAC
jgi:hypothetical protein